MGLRVGAGVADQQRVQTLAILSARRTAFEVRSHASDCGVGACELELDVTVELLEGLHAQALTELSNSGFGVTPFAQLDARASARCSPFSARCGPSCQVVIAARRDRRAD